MFKQISFFLIIGISSITSAFAQPGYVMLKSGERIQGRIDLSAFKNEGIVVISTNRAEYSYSSKDAQSVYVYQVGHYFVKSVGMLMNDISEVKKEIFLRPIEEGRVSLWEAYGEEFDFVLEKKKRFTALQTVVGENSDADATETEHFRVILQKFFSDCSMNQDIAEVGYNEYDLTQLLNVYNNCSEQRGKGSKRGFALTFDVGFQESSLNFIVDSPHFLEDGVTYNLEYASSNTYFAFDVRNSSLNGLLDVGAGFRINSYKFEPQLSDSILSGDSFDFNEVQLNAFFEPKIIIGRFYPSVKIGAAVHYTFAGDTDEVDASVIRKRPPERVLMLEPKKEGEIKSMYPSFFIAPSLNFKINNSFSLGLILNYTSEINETITENNAFSEDIIKHSSWGIRVSYELKN